MEHVTIQPSVHLLESLRSVGYSFAAAISDIIDNSITAESTTITIDADVVNGSHVAILDNGKGMTPSTAREALRFAGSVGARTENDLGRFGLGLKTASLSQSRQLTVVTRKDRTLTALEWDLDYVQNHGQWLLKILPENQLSELPLAQKFLAQESGTLVLWRHLDLLLGDTTEPGKHLSQNLASLREHLSLTFHRYLADSRDSLTITVNGIRLQALDPFLASNPKTQHTPVEKIVIDGAEILVESFTLPHPSALTQAERKRPDLGDGMRAAQGFYIYRNRRLISHGNWYGLARMSELSKQTRIKVDIPTALDSLWQIDIKKSQAEPPPSFKIRLKQLIQPILEKGHRVHTFRGRKERATVSHIWEKQKTRTGIRYEINLENPVVTAALSPLSVNDRARVTRLLETVAESFPHMDAYVEIAQNSLATSPDTRQDDVENKLIDIRNSGILDSDPNTAFTQLNTVEPFNKVAGLDSLIKKIWKEHAHASE